MVAAKRVRVESTTQQQQVQQQQQQQQQQELGRGSVGVAFDSLFPPSDFLHVPGDYLRFQPSLAVLRDGVNRFFQQPIAKQLFAEWSKRIYHAFIESMNAKKRGLVELSTKEAAAE